MSVTQISDLFAVYFAADAQASSPVLIPATSYADKAETEIDAEINSGQLFPGFMSIVAQKLMREFATPAIASVLDEVGLLGMPIASASQTGLVGYAHAHASGAGRQSGSNHRSFTIKKGLVIPKTLQVDHQGNASLSFEAIAIYDGTNNPIVVADSVALPTGLTDDERFTLGPVAIGGVALNQKTSLSIDFGIKAEAISADSDIWDTYISVHQVEPEITFGGIDKSWIDVSGSGSKIPLLGLAGTHANSSIYLRKRAAGGTSFVANATAEHIKMTIDGLAVGDTIWEADGQSPGKTALRMKLRWDGTNYPITFDTTSAIT